MTKTATPRTGIKLQCLVADEMKRELKSIAASRGERLRATCIYLCDLAFDDPDGPKKSYAGMRSEKCVVTVEIAFVDRSRAYRAHHGLEKNTEFFYDALLRGIEAHNRQESASRS